MPHADVNRLPQPRHGLSLPGTRERPLEFFGSFVDSVCLVGSLWLVALFFGEEIGNPYLLFGFVIFSLTFPGNQYLRASPLRMIRDIVLGWGLLAGLLFLFGWAAHFLKYFDMDVILHWLWLGPLCQVLGHMIFRGVAELFVARPDESRRAVIVGANDQGMMLVDRIVADPLCGLRVEGIFDDRSAERIKAPASLPLLGRLDDLPAFVQANHVDVILLSLPMTTQTRILKLLDDLRDTTASIYFVPDFFVTDLIQGRMDAIADVPVVAVCESPFVGINGIVKRSSDIVLSLIILTLMSPLLLVIALGVKLSSPGPVIFKQRRYGLDGREILVYKFRSMTVCEDGPVIVQARKTDARITRLGAFLRKTSLDELPQFINVLQGRMSIVGPRPHAVAHNELYRGQIKGYMVRHKVKPGITGWAQVNGLRGETDTVDKMRARVEHDLDYLRNWSLRLDLYIIARTVATVLRDQYAY
jgi:putative colanic acid biosynthesis UDP-glucose lipid carrier transferase